MTRQVVDYVTLCPAYPFPAFGIIDASGNPVVGRDGLPARWSLRDVANDVAAALD